MIHAAIFDLDDTLFLERDYMRSGYAAVAEYLEKRKKGTGTGQTAGPSQSPFFEWLWARFERGQTAGAFDDLNAHFSLGLAKADIDELVKVYREHRPTISPIPGIPDLLSQLHGRFALGLLADGFLPAQRLKLAALGLERFFDAIVFTEELGRDAWKPSPAGFELMQEKMGLSGCHASGAVAVSQKHESLNAHMLPRTEAWHPENFPVFAYISDNPSKDFVAPNRLGWRTIQLAYPGQVHAHLPAPEGGRPQFVARLPGEVYQILIDAPRHVGGMYPW